MENTKKVTLATLIYYQPNPDKTVFGVYRGTLWLSGTHVVKCPTGAWTFGGSVPIILCDKREATVDDIRGQRWFKENGKTWTWKVPVFKSEREARKFAKKQRVKLNN